MLLSSILKFIDANQVISVIMSFIYCVFLSYLLYRHSSSPYYYFLIFFILFDLVYTFYCGKVCKSDSEDLISSIEKKEINSLNKSIAGISNMCKIPITSVNNTINNNAINNNMIGVNNANSANRNKIGVSNVYGLDVTDVKKENSVNDVNDVNGVNGVNDVNDVNCVDTNGVNCVDDVTGNSICRVGYKDQINCVDILANGIDVDEDVSYRKSIDIKDLCYNDDVKMGKVSMIINEDTCQSEEGVLKKNRDLGEDFDEYDDKSIEGMGIKVFECDDNESLPGIRIDVCDIYR